MALYRVHLHLARSKEYPEGSSRCGYEFVVPLDDEMKLDPEQWKNHKDDCTVHRFWEGEEDLRGKLRHVGKGWKFDYDENDDEDDELFFKLDRHKLAEGEYVSIRERDGEMHTFKVVAVRPYP